MLRVNVFTSNLIVGVVFGGGGCLFLSPDFALFWFALILSLER